MMDDVRRTKSSGNVYEDLGFDMPEEWATKADIAVHILRVIDERELTQAAAAEVLEISQPDVSNLKRGQLDRFTIDRLFRFLAALDQHIDISILPQSKAKSKEMVTVRGSS